MRLTEDPAGLPYKLSSSFIGKGFKRIRNYYTLLYYGHRKDTPFQPNIQCLVFPFFPATQDFLKKIGKP
jgi:hypothetical protein